MQVAWWLLSTDPDEVHGCEVAIEPLRDLLEKVHVDRFVGVAVELDGRGGGMDE